jgi:hypothetical protein
MTLWICNQESLPEMAPGNIDRWDVNCTKLSIFHMKCKETPFAAWSDVWFPGVYVVVPCGMFGYIRSSLYFGEAQGCVDNLD